MKHYKKPGTNEIFAYEDDGSQDDLIDPTYIPITDQEADDIRLVIEQVQFDALPYWEKREAHYPDMYEYIDGLVKGDQAQIDKYFADCRAVKARFPKP